MTHMERILKHVVLSEDPSGCFEMVQVKRPNSKYGVKRYYVYSIKINGKWTMTGAHRLAYELFYGVSPGNKLVLHHCDNMKCVKPDHLYLGNYKDNKKDQIERGHQVRGEICGTSILKNDDILNIRERFANGETHTGIAKDYRVSKATIGNIIHGRTWKHI